MFNLRIGVNGYFGGGTFGDDLFLEKWKQLFSEHEVINLFNYHNTDIEKIKSCDKIIIGGGSILEQYQFNKWFWKEEFLEKPTYVYGVGVSDVLPKSKDALKKYADFLSKYKGLYFRNKLGLEFLDKTKIKYNIVNGMIWDYDLPEDIMKISIENDLKNQSNKDTIGITLKAREKNEDIYKLCEQIINLGYKIKIISLYIADCNENLSLYNFLNEKYNKDKDNSDSDNKDNKISFTNYTYPSDINNILNEINSLRFYITQKMHGFMSAMLLKIPSICIGSSNKFKNLANNNNLGINKLDCVISYEDSIIEKFENKFLDKYDFSIIDKLKKETKEQLDKFRDIILENYLE